MKLTPLARRVLKLAPFQIEAWANRNRHNPDLPAALREIDGLIQAAALVRGYLDERGGHGCGDNGHIAARTKANRTATHIRRALGYSYPKQDLTF